MTIASKNTINTRESVKELHKLEAYVTPAGMDTETDSMPVVRVSVDFALAMPADKFAPYMDSTAAKSTRDAWAELMPVIARMVVRPELVENVTALRVGMDPITYRAPKKRNADKPTRAAAAVEAAANPYAVTVATESAYELDTRAAAANRAAAMERLDGMTPAQIAAMVELMAERGIY